MSQVGLGEHLRVERENRGITIEQVASSTKISLKLLIALEGDQYRDLPAKPFVRGFVISYCRFIGIDHKEILSKFDPYLDHEYSKLGDAQEKYRGYAFEKTKDDRGRYLLVGVIGAFAVLGAVLIFVLKPALKRKEMSQLAQLQELTASQKKNESAKSGEEKKEPKPAAVKVEQAAVGPVQTESEKKESEAEQAEDEKEVAEKKEESQSEEKKEPEKKEEVEVAEKKEEEKKEPESEPESQPEPQRKVAVSVEPNRVPLEKDLLNKGDDLKGEQIFHKVVFKALEDLWVRYQVDGKPVMRFMLKKDKLLVLRASEKIRFQVSNPASATYRYNRGGAYYRVLDSNEVFVENGTSTLVFPKPTDPLKKKFFPGMTPLPKTASPGERPESDSEGA